jgi:hypothetical protein
MQETYIVLWVLSSHWYQPFQLCYHNSQGISHFTQTPRKIKLKVFPCVTKQDVEIRDTWGGGVGGVVAEFRRYTYMT